jgi:hypothetical protein
VSAVAKVSDPRRFARLPSRCRVWVRDRYGVWDAHTEDISARGCRIVTPRPLAVGTLVRLTLTDDRLEAPLIVAGQVVWSEGDRPVRAGISFTGSPQGVPGPTPWVQSLEAAETGRTRAAPDVPLAAGPVLDVVIAPPEPVDASPAVLARRLSERAQALLEAGQPGPAEVLLRRALAHAPDDARIRALLATVASEGGAG